ncbi:hypothetical protein V7S76_02610 [Aquirufa sp. ROCK2-A2]
MKLIFKKYLNGWISIVLIKLVVLASVILLNSCEKNTEIIETSAQKESIQKFENIAKQTTFKLKNSLTNRMSVMNVNRKDTLSKEIMTEIEAKSKLLPLLEASKELLLSYGIDEAEISESLDKDDPRIIVLSLAIFSSKFKNQDVALNLNSILGTELYANKADPDVLECALKAGGVKTLYEIFKDGVVTKAVLKKALKTIAKKYIGAVGIAFGLYEFGSCMEWY